MTITASRSPSAADTSSTKPRAGTWTPARVSPTSGGAPGLGATGFALSVFNGGGWSTNNISIPGRTRSPNDRSVVLNIVGARYLDVMKMPILAGRGLSERDTASSPKVAVINEAMARTYFGEPLPLGRTFSVSDDEKADSQQWKDVEVVGVVRGAKYFTLLEQERAAVFFPHAQHLRLFLFDFVVRHDPAAPALLAPIRTAVAEVDANLPIRSVTTLTHRVDDSVVNRRAIAHLSAFFGVLALLLASIGIYGVTAYGIARRTNEFGVRIALGAQRRDVLRLVLGEIARLGAAGVALGLIIALSASRFIASLLFRLTRHDLVLARPCVCSRSCFSPDIYRRSERHASIRWSRSDASNGDQPTSNLCPLILIIPTSALSGSLSGRAVIGPRRNSVARRGRVHRRE